MIKKIINIFLLFIIILTVCSNGYYNFRERFTALKLTRNIEQFNYEIFYDRLEFENIMVRIEFDKEIELIDTNSGFVLSENKKNITKICTEDEYVRVSVRDYDFNYQEIEFFVDLYEESELPIMP